MRLLTAVTFSIAAGCAVIPTASMAISANDTIELAGQGRYEELRQGLERYAANGPLRTRDLHALCFAYSKTKRYHKLFDCLDQMAGNIAKGDTRTRLFGLDDATPAMYLMRAEAQMELGAYAQAAQDAERVLDWIKREGDGETDMEMNALALLSMSATLSGDRNRGLQFARQLEGTSSFTLRGGNYVSVKAMAIARAYMALEDYAKTLDAIERDKIVTFHAFLDRLVSGGMLSGKNNWAWQELPRAFMVNRALRGTGKVTEAKAGYDRLLSIPQVRDNGEIYWLILFERGQIAEEERKTEEAIEFYRKAIEAIEQQRASINTESSKIGFVGNKQQVYERLIALLYATQSQSLAFEYIERSKARALVDMLASRKVSAFQSAPSPDVMTLTNEYEQAEQEALAQVPVSPSEGKAGLRSARGHALDKIRAASPELTSLISVTAVPAARLRELIPSDEVMIQYYYQGSTFYASVYADGAITMTKLNAEGLESDVRQFREAIDKEEPSALQLSRQLYERLIFPLEPMLKTKSRLLIIPHGALHYLPFSALGNGSQYLLDRFVLRTMPSASVLPYMRTPLAAGSNSMLVVGNPDLGDPQHDLPSAQAEAERIAARSPGAQLLLRGHAAETAVKASAAQYRMVHIASHGVFAKKAPLDSALLLAKDAQNDGRLTVAELYALKLDADLVTLSACETGLGQINNGDDVVGLTRGFLYAGSRNVVASLWQVDDEATAQLMVRFYEALQTKTKADSLRMAQMEVRKKYPHPYYWSAFYLTGSGR